MSKQAMYDAFMAGWSAHRQAGPQTPVLGDEEAFERWYAAIYGARDKRIADAAWHERMNEANRAAGVDLL